MVTKTCKSATLDCRFELRPNQSLSPRERRLFFVAMMVVSFSIAAWFLALGAWMVFPFAGLEMLALGGALLWIARRGEEWETLDVDGDRVRIACWRGGVARSWSFQRHWLSVSLAPPYHRGHPQRLLLGSHGRSREVGRMLTGDERGALFDALRRAVAVDFQAGA